MYHLIPSLKVRNSLSYIELKKILLILNSWHGFRLIINDVKTSGIP